ncbi:MAG: NAD(P)H-dependent oxidoreductase subunit E [Oscillospiraceae bacterium]|nr:NAD(P)H-dependent oxidoreductase subunit E [Oscillospiraceae bacterium]
MKKNISTRPFEGTAEQERRLIEAIERYKGEKGAVMQVLQLAQEIYGYLPLPVQQKIANGLDVPFAEVYGVSTFYSQFALSPKGKYQVSVCLGTACYVKGAQAVYDRLKTILKPGEDGCTADGKFSLEACRCIGACGLAPVITINDEVYGRLTEKDIDGILESYKHR